MIVAFLDQAALRRFLKWKVTYRIGVHVVVNLFQVIFVFPLFQIQ